MTDELPNLPEGRIPELARSNADKAPQVARAQAKPYWRDPARWVRDLCLLALAAFALLGYFNSLSKPDTKDLRDQVTALRQQVYGLGATPVTGSAGSAGPAGPRGARGAAGADASTAQVIQGVRFVCTTSPSLCQQPINVSRLRAEVSSCFATKQCPSPSRGPQGPSGASGAAGAPGPAPTTKQLVAALASWCGQDSQPCRGPAGSAGPSGPAGADGRDGRDAPTIVELDCTGSVLADGLVITEKRSDGTEISTTCQPPSPSGAPSS